MDCKREFTVIQIERLLLPVKWKKLDYTCMIFLISAFSVTSVRLLPGQRDCSTYIRRPILVSREVNHLHKQRFSTVYASTKSDQFLLYTLRSLGYVATQKAPCKGLSDCTEAQASPNLLSTHHFARLAVFRMKFPTMPPLFCFLYLLRCVCYILPSVQEYIPITIWHQQICQDSGDRLSLGTNWNNLVWTHMWEIFAVNHIPTSGSL